ncbi:hypothetical protein ABEY48_08640 [Bacillus mycoides]|uniref:hypothetical protein n=1 Tax=Bacillus mycoides TaxID=1405 RepID=UPI003D1D7D1C
MGTILEIDDWVYVNTGIPVESKVQKVTDIQGAWISMDLGLQSNARLIRYATEEEIREEKQRRLNS